MRCYSKKEITNLKLKEKLDLNNKRREHFQMKKIIIAAYILLCVCLTGCGGTNQKDYGENYNQEQDAQNFSMIRNAAATENGFYVLQDQYVYFIDKKSKKAVPLCGKPNCKHKDNSCNAHFTHPENIQVYAGNLYVVACK